MKLETSDLVGYIKERHYKTVRGLKAKPVLGIIVAGSEAASASFIRAKRRYAEDIGVEVRVEMVESMEDLIKQLKDWNSQSDITGIVVQLPLPAGFATDQIINQIAAAKDVDGLKQPTDYEPATAKAIMWILAAQGLNIKELKIAVIGQGRLVGLPTSAMFEASGASVVRCDVNTTDLAAKVGNCEVVITATGQPRLITRSMLRDGAIVIDAATAEAAGQLAGDVDPAVYDDPSVKATPVPGGVGPVTVAALFDNLLLAAKQ